MDEETDDAAVPADREFGGASISTDQRPLGDLIPGLADLPGAPDESLGSPVQVFLSRRGDLSWTALAALSPSELALVPNLGPIRIRKLIDELRAQVARLEPLLVRVDEAASIERLSETERSVLRALREVSTWAVGSGRSGTLLEVLESAIQSPSLDEPSAHVEFLAGLDLTALADVDAGDRYDPVLVAERFIESLDERESATLDRLLDFDGSAPTLSQVGERFGVTHEWIRQIQIKVADRVERIGETADTRPLLAAAKALRDRLGAAVPADQLVSLFASYPPDLLDRLILHLAGPYRFDGDWYILSDLGKFNEVVAGAFESVAGDGVADRRVLIDALVDQGIAPEHAERAIDDDARFQRRDDAVVDWRGSLGDKAVVCLRLAGRPMSMDEIAAFVEPTSGRGMANRVYADDRIVKVGQARYALSDWGLETFPGIEPTLAARVADGPRSLDELCDELADAYGVSVASVRSIASSHPGFRVRNGMLSLRGEDDPYIPSSNLELTRGCYLVDGLWAWRTEVTSELLRGIGPRLPEAFAVHLGGIPLARGTLSSPHGTVGLSWGRQPAIGSLRAAARSLDAEEGDWLFVRRVRSSEIDFLLVHADDLSEEPEQRLRALVGAAESTADLEQVLADALGLRGSVNHDLREERAALAARRDHDLVELLDATGV